MFQILCLGSENKGRTVEMVAPLRTAVGLSCRGRLTCRTADLLAAAIVAGILGLVFVFNDRLTAVATRRGSKPQFLPPELAVANAHGPPSVSFKITENLPESARRELYADASRAPGELSFIWRYPNDTTIFELPGPILVQFVPWQWFEHQLLPGLYRWFETHRYPDTEESEESLMSGLKASINLECNRETYHNTYHDPEFFRDEIASFEVRVREEILSLAQVILDIILEHVKNKSKGLDENSQEYFHPGPLTNCLESDSLWKAYVNHLSLPPKAKNFICAKIKTKILDLYRRKHELRARHLKRLAAWGSSNHRDTAVSR